MHLCWRTKEHFKSISCQLFTGWHQGHGQKFSLEGCLTPSLKYVCACVCICMHSQVRNFRNHANKCQIVSLRFLPTTWLSFKVRTCISSYIFLTYQSITCFNRQCVRVRKIVQGATCAVTVEALSSNICKIRHVCLNVADRALLR